MDSYIDVDQFVFQRKQEHWRSPITLVAPTHFMADQARRSTIASPWPITTIPHPIDPETFRPQDPQGRASFRSSVGLSPSAPSVLFASSPGSDFNKGLDLVSKVMSQLHKRISGIQLVTIGGPWSSLPDYVLQFKPISNDNAFANWLSAVDLVIVPSRLESFSLVAAEAQICGTPVLSFDTSGLRDVVGTQRPDRSIPQWDWQQMANKAEETLKESTGTEQALRDQVTKQWAPRIVGAAYVNSYRESINADGSTPPFE
jgi:glycosyltransferase involved in cell wall biosynthesis